MIRVPIKSREGVYRVMRTRVPRTRTFFLYRQAEANDKAWLQALYAAICNLVQAHPEARSHRAVALMAEVSAQGSRAARTLKFSFSDAKQRSLFEQVLWTFFFDQPDTWETSWPEPGQDDAEYVAVRAGRIAQHPADPRQMAPAARAAKARSRGLDAAPAATTAVASDDELKIGDIVKVVEGRYTGLIGQVVAIPVVGGFERYTVRLPGDDQYYDVPNFPAFALEKVSAPAH